MTPLMTLHRVEEIVGLHQTLGLSQVMVHRQTPGRNLLKLGNIVHSSLAPPRLEIDVPYGKRLRRVEMTSSHQVDEDGSIWRVGIPTLENLQTLEMKRLKSQVAPVVPTLRLAKSQYPECDVLFCPRGSNQVVYFIQQLDNSTNTSMLKIGRTTNLDRRLRGLQTGNPYTLIPLLVTNAVTEAETHQLFAEQRLYADSEWFAFPYGRKQQKRLKLLLSYKIKQAAPGQPVDLERWLSLT